MKRVIHPRSDGTAYSAVWTSHGSPLIASSLPIDLTSPVGLNIGDDKRFEGVSNRISIIVKINLSDLQSIVRLQYAFLGGSLDLDQHLTW